MALSYLFTLGIDTVELKGEGFTRIVQEGQQVYQVKQLLNLIWLHWKQRQNQY